MFALNPRFLNADLDLDKVQFFIDYCNSMILGSRPITTAHLPTFKVLTLGMQVEVTDPSDPTKSVIRDATLNETEKAFVEKLMTSVGWICFFCKRDRFQELVVKGDDATCDVLYKLLVKYPEDFTEEVFVMATMPFKERDPNQKKVESTEGGDTPEVPADPVVEG